MAGGLASIEHVVVLMLENRSFDHMLGYLYTGAGNVSPAGQPYEGLTGKETNQDSSGKPVPVFQITPSTPNAYFMPGADPGEGYKATNDQLWGSDNGPSSAGQPATSQGFVADFAYTIGWETSEKWSIVPGTTSSDIMGCFTPEALPVLSALARGYAVCDHWFASAPTETMPNRAFTCAGTSQGHMDDKTHTFTAPSIFASLDAAGQSWGVYGYDATPLTKGTFTDITNAAASHFGLFTDFKAAAAAGTLPAFTFLEPSWGSTGNSQHPNYDVALGEQLIHDVYEALRSGPGWPGTLFVLTYDEHGGCYDHVAPPWGATPPDDTAGEYGFGFDRFGVRVPAVLISPLILAGTVYRVPAGGPPLDHTSILKTVRQRWNLSSLTAREAAAPGFGDVLTLTTPRTDDVLAGVTVPVSGSAGPSAGQLSHLEAIREDLVSRFSPDARPGMPA
ncbi:MAG TPA: alkaline phosphatase family protein [Trebonia sp.]|jgi:phospholipase C|nr:alkaline phosphatase family protein [Trebonia sp.]